MKFRLSVQICGYSFSKECWRPKSINETNRLYILQNTREYKMQNIWQPRELERREMMCAKKNIEWTNDWMSEYCLCTYTNGHIRASKSGMIDVVVEIHFFCLNAGKRYSCSAIRCSESVGRLVSRCFRCCANTITMYLHSPHPLNHCLHISTSTSRNSIATHGYHLQNLISAFLWLILLSWCIMNERTQRWI